MSGSAKGGLRGLVDLHTDLGRNSNSLLTNLSSELHRMNPVVQHHVYVCASSRNIGVTLQLDMLA